MERSMEKKKKEAGTNMHSKFRTVLERRAHAPR